MGNTPELERQLRGELIDRLDRYPMDEWSCPLIRAVIVTMDLFPSGSSPMSPQRRGLRLIR